MDDDGDTAVSSSRGQRLFRVALLALIACYTGCKKAPNTTAQAMVLMDEYRAHQRYDDAIGVAREWLDQHPDDSRMHAYIALVYLQKARTEPKNAASLIEEALRQAYKAIEADPEDVATMRLAAISLEDSADMSERDRCKHYVDASRMRAHVMKTLNPEFEKGGRVQSRHDLEAAQLRVQKKGTAAGCKENN